MICEKPYIRTPTGVNKIQLLSEAGREAATPFACGKCFPCRLNKQRMITGRIMMENQFHDHSLFCTFTYADEYLPEDKSVHHSEVKNYVRRLKRKGLKFRYFFTGEYGDENQRPHYHSIMFGTSPEDCNIMHDVWGKGRTAYGHVTPASARYVAGYAFKNMLREDDKRLDGRKPEFHCSSRDPKGIGTQFLEVIIKEMEKYGEKEINGTVVLGGKTYPIGRYFGSIISDRLNKTIGEKWDASDERLARYQNKIFQRYDTGRNWLDEITNPMQPHRDQIEKLHTLKVINYRKGKRGCEKDQSTACHTTIS